MNQELLEKYNFIDKTLKEVRTYQHASSIINFDLETICPPAGMEEQGELCTFFNDKMFRLVKSNEFIEATKYLHEHREELDNNYQKVLSDSLYRDYLLEKNITPEINEEFSRVYNKAYIDWLNAKKQNDFKLFAPSLKEISRISKKQISLLDKPLPVIYDNLLDQYERGMTSNDLNDAFNKCKEKLVPFLKKIMNSKKKIRFDFLSRKVSDEQQKEMAKYLLDIMKFDSQRGAFTTTEHPFTDQLGYNDTRVTTHYYDDAFISSMYSIIHEGGHALFEMYQPKENFTYHICGNKTLGMHESSSRFYENIIGRSKEFIHFIYPKCKEIFSNVLYDVSEEELYEAINIVTPSLIRTEADEFTYTFHIIIRYEIEQMILNDEVSIDDLPSVWNQKYQEYLGITPESDKDGVLQDVHWSGGFGYFPTYAIGNFYNAMYFNKMKETIDVSKALSNGDFDTINSWMINNVWNHADVLSPKEWIKEITNRQLTVDDFISYLIDKYSKIYEIEE